MTEYTAKKKEQKSVVDVFCTKVSLMQYGLLVHRFQMMFTAHQL